MRYLTSVSLAVPILLGAPKMSAQGRPPDQSKPSQAAQPTKQVAWPALPHTGFIRGRAASSADVSAGNAVFVAQDSGKIVGQPLAISIPQFALWHDQKSGQDKRVVVIQAERARGLDIVGFREISTGTDGVALLSEFTLLGEHPPSVR